MQKKSIKDYLRFNKKERLAFFIVAIIVALIFIYPFVFNNKEEQPLVIVKSAGPAKPNDNTNQNYDRDNEDSNYQYQSYGAPSYKTHTSFRDVPVSKLFYFDPNTASVEDWLKLGLRDRTIRTIKNYLSKGGSFRQKEDLMKIYGLHEDEYARLEPYITIVSKPNGGGYKSQTQVTSHWQPYSSFNKARDVTIADINTADAEAFIALPGIGNSFAKRIINFREKLGGFYSVDQVRETYGLPDSTYELIRPMLKLNSGVRKININTASKDELRAHPYMRWNIANAIVEYRNQHGAFSSLEDLKKIVLIDDELFMKITPYLSIN